MKVSAAFTLMVAIAMPASARLGTAAVHEDTKTKKERAERLVELHEKKFKPSKEALAQNEFANNETVPEDFSKSYKQLYAAYEHLDPHYFPLQPYYKYPTMYALGEEQLLYPWGRMMRDAKELLAYPVGSDRNIMVGLASSYELPELVSADGQKLAVHGDDLFRYPMAARFFADPNCTESVWNLAALLAYNTRRFFMSKEYVVKQNFGVADARRGLMFPYEDGQEIIERERIMMLMAREVVDIDLIAKCVLDLYQKIDTDKNLARKAFYMLAANELYKQVLVEHSDYSSNASKLNKQLMYFTRYDNTPEFAQVINEAIVMPEPPTMALKPGAMDKQLNAQILRIIRQRESDIIRVVVINDSWTVHMKGVVPTDRAVMAWAVYKNKKGKLEAHDYSFCQDYQGGGRYGALRYKGIGTRTVYVK